MEGGFITLPNDLSLLWLPTFPFNLLPWFTMAVILKGMEDVTLIFMNKVGKAGPKKFKLCSLASDSTTT